MAFRFESRGNIERQVRRIAREQFDKALGDIEGEKTFDEAVHSARRRCKRLRGLLRLIRPAFEHFERENVALRNAASGLSGARDAAVMVETFKSLRTFDTAEGRTARIGAEAGAAMERLLQERTGTQDGGNQDAMLATFRAAMRDGRERAETWDLDGDGFASIGAGLEATYERMGKRLRKAAKVRTAAAFHDWRKDTKYHWHHVGLFEAAAPDLLAPRKRSLDRLGEFLGDHHNLAVLAEVLESEGAGAATRVDRDDIAAVIAERQADLETEAFALGRQLTAEAPAALRSRFHGYWCLLKVNG